MLLSPLGAAASPWTVAGVTVSQPLSPAPLLVAAQEDLSPAPLQTPVPSGTLPQLCSGARPPRSGVGAALLGANVCLAHVTFSLISVLLLSPGKFLEPPLISPPEDE